MVGLVNAAGAAETSRLATTQRAATEADGSNLAPVLSSEQAVNKVLHKAVESVMLQVDNRDRTFTSGESDRTQQADLEAGGNGALGMVLDVTA